MHVTKRDGNLKPFDIKQIRKQTIPACDGLPGVNYETLELKAQIAFKDGIKTSDITKIYIKTALSLVDVDVTKWTYVAARLYLYDLYHRVKRTYYGKKIDGDVYKAIPFKKYIEYNRSRLSFTDEMLAKFDLDELDKIIDPKRDLLFNFIQIWAGHNIP